MAKKENNKKNSAAQERRIVNLFKEAGFPAKRAYASQGSALGLDDKVDVAVYKDKECTEVLYKIQCKRRMNLSEDLFKSLINVDFAIWQKTDEKKPLLAVIEFEKLLEILLQRYDEEDLKKDFYSRWYQKGGL